jgi:hypothetical protein
MIQYMKDGPVVMPPKHPRKTEKKRHTNFFALSWIPTNDTNARTAEGPTRLRHGDNCAQQSVETRAMQC